MLVSIIIPIYKVEEFIERCLNSVFQQTYYQIEIILVDDCSPDRSMEIAYSVINDYNDKFPYTIIKHQFNKGISESRNDGMKVARGDYFYFIDSDDELAPTAIETLMQVAQKDSSIEIVEGQFLKGAIVNWNEFNNLLNFSEVYKNNDARRLFLRKPYAWNLLLKASFIKENSITFLPGVLFEDKIFRQTLLNKLTTYAIIDTITYFYRYNKYGITNSITPKHLTSLLNILKITENSIENGNECLRYVLINDYCTFSFNYWNLLWRKHPLHKDFYTSYSSILRLFLIKHYKELNLYQIFLISPSILPYCIAKYFVKLIWLIRARLSTKNVDISAKW